MVSWLLGKSKLVTVGIVCFVIWFFSICIFIGTFFLAFDSFNDIIQVTEYGSNLNSFIVHAISLLLGIIVFITATICISLFFTKNTTRSAASDQSKPQFFKKFSFIVLIFPFYTLYRLIHDSKPGKKRVFSFITSVFVFLVFIPIWLISYLSVVGIIAYAATSALGYAPVLEYVAGTGSMYPTFPKGDGKTDKENAMQAVATVTFLRYPGGVEVFGKRYFNHILERGDIIAFQNKMTEETTKKQYGEATGYIKRVIALPGDTIELRNGLVYLNSKPLKEPYTAGAHSTFAEEFLSECKKITVPSGKIFVMGDNRKGSGDSREFGFIDFKDVRSVLTIKNQKGTWDKNWRNTSRDFDEKSKIKINKEKYLSLLNEKRKAAGVPALIYEDKLAESAQKRGEIILKFDDFSFEATRSGYTMSRAMNDVGYFNPLYGESPSQGYFTAEELIENQFAFPESQEFLLEKDYDEVGISEVEGEINGCPTQILVQHFAGYVPPNYSQADVASWQQSLANLREIQPGWAELKISGDFYQQHKGDVDRINELIGQRIANVSAVLAKMQANQWLGAAEERMIDQDEALANEINMIADRLNSK